MPYPNHYQAVKLEHGERVNQVKNLTQKDWIRICKKLGLYVSVGNGKGSHCAVYKSNTCPPEDSTCCILTIPCNIYPNFQRDMIKKIIYGKCGTPLAQNGRKLIKN